MHEATQTISVVTKEGLSQDFYDLPVDNDPPAAQTDENNNVVITVPGTDNLVEQRVTFAAGHWQEVHAYINAPRPEAVLGAAV